MVHDVSQSVAAVQENEPLEDTLTIPQAMKILQISRPTMMRLLKRGELPACKVGKQWRFQPKHLRAFLDTGAVSRAREKPARKIIPLDFYNALLCAAIADCRDDQVDFLLDSFRIGNDGAELIQSGGTGKHNESPE